MSTITREECVNSLNDFFRSHSPNKAIILLKYYLEDKDEKAIPAIMQLVSQNSALLDACILKVIRELETKYSLIELSKDNNPILVY